MARKLKEPKVKIGDRFGKLTVVKQVSKPIVITIKDKDGNIHEEETGKVKNAWFCKCDCGGKIVLTEKTLLTERSSIRSCNNCPPEENPNYIPKDMTYEDNQKWNELYEYVKNNIFNYNDSIKLSDSSIMRLKGLTSGKYFAGKKSKNNAKYSYEVVLNTFKFCYTDIQRALKNNNFKDEQHKMNYIAKIIENNINDVYIKMKKIEQQKQSVKRDDDSRILEYVNTFKIEEEDISSKSNLYEDLW